MKVNLTIRGTILNGYLNLDPTTQTGEADRILCKVDNLNDLIEHNEIDDHFIVNEVLDFVPLNQRLVLLNHYLTKLAHGAKIIIIGTDIYEVSRFVHLGQIDVSQANNAVYGIGRKSFCRPQDNVDIAMQTNQFTVDSIKCNPNIPYQYIVTLTRK